MIPASYLISAKRIFTGKNWLENHYLYIDQNFVKDISPLSQRPQGLPHYSFEDSIIAPGFIDVQVNGGGGLLFNNSICVETLQTMVNAHSLYGTTGLLPTLITDTWEKTIQAIQVVQQAIDSGVSGVLGLHLEGPFLNPDFRGTHLPKYMQTPHDALFDELSIIHNGCSMMTIAPEIFTTEQIQQLANQGWKLFCGHSGASYSELQERVPAGVCGFTHFFNAMRQISSREPGVVGYGLESQQTWCSLIADGLHVDPANLRLLLKNKPQQVLLVTDAMALVGSAQTQFDLQGKTITLKDGTCYDENNVFSGSHLGMSEGVAYMMQVTNEPLEEVLRMASYYPAKMLGLENSHGHIALNIPANLIAMSCETYQVNATVIQGKLSTF